MRHILKIVLLVAMLATWSVAQAVPAASGPGAQQDDSVQPEAQTSVPAPIAGQGGSLEFSSGLARSNYFRGGLGFTTAFDDNALNSSTDTVSNVSYSILPHFALDQSRGHLKWTLDYAGGLVINQRLTSQNQGSHTAGLQADYRVSPHLTIRLSDRFNDTTNFFSGENTFTASTAGVLQRPNDLIVTPLARAIGNFSQAEADYQVGAGTVVGGSGSYYFSRFSDVTNGAGNSSSLVDTQSEQAQGFITHRITARNWAGLTYRFQRLTFQSGSNETLVHSILYYHTIYLQPTMTLSLFAGPEYTDVSSQTISQVIQLPFILVVSTPVVHRSWAGSGGASFAWHGRQTSMQVDAIRRVSDGGGLLGAVRTSSVDGSVRRQITRSSAVLLGAAFGVNDSIDFLSAPGSSVRLISGRLGYERKLANNLSFSFGYDREHQLQESSGGPSTNIDHNRGWITLSYDFSRPLGR